MAWSTPPTFTTGQLIGATDLNAYVRDNTNYLLSGWPIGFLAREGVADYSLTNTAFADVDAANLILTMFLASTRAFIFASFGQVPVVGQSSEFDIIANSTTRAGGTNGIYETNNGIQQAVSFFARFTGLTPGSNTFKLQSRSTGAGTYTIKNNPMPIVLIGWGM